MKYDWIGLRECARRVGRHHHALQKAIADGRVPASAVRRDERGRIVAVDYMAAAIAWRASTDASQAERTAPPLRIPGELEDPTPAPIQTSGLAMSAALEVAIVAMPALLERLGVAPDVVTRALAELRTLIEQELRGRGVLEEEIAELVGTVLVMAAEERAHAGSWTA